jgi:hypothetical protein
MDAVRDMIDFEMKRLPRANAERVIARLLPSAHTEPMLPSGSVVPLRVVNAMQRLPSVDDTDSEVSYLPMLLAEDATTSMAANAEKIWLPQRHHVAQALLFVLRAANDTLAAVPFASLVLNGATRAIKTFEVIYPFLCMIMNLYLLGFQQTVWQGEAVANASLSSSDR